MKDFLVLAGRIPFPLDDGWKIRTFHLLKALVETGANVDVLVFDETGRSNDYPELKRLCRDFVVIPRNKKYSLADLLFGVVNKVPFSVLNYFDENFLKEFERLVSNNDYSYIHVEDVVMAQYAKEFTRATKILDMHNIESNLLYRYASHERNFFKKYYALLTSKKLLKYEIKCIECFDAILVCSLEDKIALNCHNMLDKIHVIPNGVDASVYSDQTSSAKENALVFVGSMDYHANISGIEYFYAHILPLLRARHPGLLIYVVGKNPPSHIRALHGDGVVVTGAVDDVRPYLHRSAISIVPLLVGGGTRLKILEAMAAGLPVVSTSQGAEGIAAVHGREILIADTPQKFADAVSSLLENASERDRLARSGREFVLQHYDWTIVTQALKSVIAHAGGEPV